MNKKGMTVPIKKCRHCTHNDGSNLTLHLQLGAMRFRMNCGVVIEKNTNELNEVERGENLGFEEYALSRISSTVTII